MKDELPDPRGRKSLPTTLSNTEDFPELWDFPQKKHIIWERYSNIWKRRLKDEKCEPGLRRQRRKEELPKATTPRRRDRLGRCRLAGSGSPARSSSPLLPYFSRDGFKATEDLINALLQVWCDLYDWGERERKIWIRERNAGSTNNEGFNHWIIKKNGLDAERGSRERERENTEKNGWGMKPNSCFYFFSCCLRNLALLESYYVCFCITSHISKKKYFRNNLFLFFFPSFAFPYELQKW